VCVCVTTGHCKFAKWFATSKNKPTTTAA
jgi:hypothetical protein